MPEQYKTENDFFDPIFSADREQRFEGWRCCIGGQCINMPLEQQRVEEKIIGNYLSELKCVNCGATDVYYYSRRHQVDALRTILLEAFGDLDAVVFK